MRLGDATVVAGLNEIVAPLKRNVALVFGEDGAIAGRYLKRHRIPGIEDGYVVGEGPLLVPPATPAWGPQRRGAADAARGAGRGAA